MAVLPTHPLNFRFPADYRVHLGILGHLIEVTAIFFQQGHAVPRMTAPLGFMGTFLPIRLLGVNAVHDFILQIIRVHAHQLQHFHCCPFCFFEQAQENMLRADVAVPKALGFLKSPFHNPLGSRGIVRIIRRILRFLGSNAFNLRRGLFKAHA